MQVNDDLNSVNIYFKSQLQFMLFKIIRFILSSECGLLTGASLYEFDTAGWTTLFANEVYVMCL